MKLIHWILTVAVLLSLLSSCDDDQQDLRDYYFPLRELTDGLVYEYRDLNYDSLSADFWYYRTVFHT